MANDVNEQIEKVSINQYYSEFYFEERRKDLEVREKELMKREAFNDSKRKVLHLRKQMNDKAAKDQKRLDETVLMLAEKQKKEKETFHQRNMEQQKIRYLNQALELEIEHLTGAIMQVTEHLGKGQHLKKKLDEIEESLNEKKEELKHLETLNQALVVEDQKTNVELSDARKAMIDVMKENSSRSLIGVNKMGDLDVTRFQEITKGKFLGIDSDLKAAQLFSTWEHQLRDPTSYPFKHVTSENGSKEIIIDGNDERLNRLNHEFGEAANDLVTCALMEMNEGPSSRCITTVLWNNNLGRKATLNEGISYLLQKLKASKAKKRLGSIW